MADRARPAPFDLARSDALGRVPHGFFGSAGGAHQFGFGGPGGEGEVRALRAAAADALVPCASPVAPHQVHSSDCLAVTEPWPDQAEGRPVADALVTDRPGIVLGIVTADCGPVLFADAQAGVVAAAHAGWRGAQSGVLDNTLAAMESLGARRERIVAALGPTIAQPSYEVDAPFRDHFGPDDARHFAPAPPRDGRARWHFDLPGYIGARLEALEIGTFDDLALDTFALADRYHSYRRASLAGAPSYGRQISAIARPE
ncbi:polyphenol oxidase family protein [Qipengyuania nanhaisediminis]|uniref:polyphenol oxidase family protein n=1 Tax=Qipengyuania nanhaisediminis TaxID=604088 RepID=UPI0038B3EEE5